MSRDAAPRVARRSGEGDLEAYARRLGFRRPLSVDLDTLRRLHAAHMRLVPFENSSVLFGEAVTVNQAAAVRKIGVEGRGGWCYELNGAFAALLSDAGFRVDFLDARTYDHDRLGRHFEHLALRVTLDGPWLVDVGFGYSFVEPLKLQAGIEQRDPLGDFRLVDADAGYDLEWRHRDGRWVGHYRVDPRPVALRSFTAMCRRLRTSADSPFTRDWLCSAVARDGGVTLFGRRLIVSRGAEREERVLEDDEVAPLLERWFGVRARWSGDRWLPADQKR